MYKLFTDEFGNEYVKLIHSPQSHTLIPLKEENADYQRYLKWLAKGNTPEPADPVLEQVTPEEERMATMLLLKSQKGEALTVEEIAERDKILSKLEGKKV